MKRQTKLALLESHRYPASPQACHFHYLLLYFDVASSLVHQLNNMGFKHHQNYSPEIFQPNIQSTGPPPLPPRANAASPCPSFNPPSYSEARQTYYSQPLTQSWSAQDPRSSSSQSLVPTPTGQEDERRTLLLIYIHGFLGNETSFQSFPAHVHNVVTVNLANTHVVHTKIYPRYKSRKAIEYATDDFSNW